jgi:DNA-binding response OmpR family regulator
VRILIVEDEKKLANFVRRALREDGHAVDLCHEGTEGAHLATTEPYDAVVLDLQLPGQDGIEILRELRKRKKTTPVLILTARDRVTDRIHGLDEGADDYMTKPFSLDELRARVRALLRRGSTSPANLLSFADLQMDLLQRTVRRGDRLADLTPREFSLLEFFLRNPDRAVTRSSIAEHVWDYNFEWNSNVVDVFVNNVRKKLETEGESRLIHTVRGVGYALRESNAEER